MHDQWSCNVRSGRLEDICLAGLLVVPMAIRDSLRNYSWMCFLQTRRLPPPSLWPPDHIAWRSMQVNVWTLMSKFLRLKVHKETICFHFPRLTVTTFVRVHLVFTVGKAVRSTCGNSHEKEEEEKKKDHFQWKFSTHPSIKPSYSFLDVGFPGF